MARVGDTRSDVTRLIRGPNCCQHDDEETNAAQRMNDLRGASNSVCLLGPESDPKIRRLLTAEHNEVVRVLSEKSFKNSCYLLALEHIPGPQRRRRKRVRIASNMSENGNGCPKSTNISRLL